MDAERIVVTLGEKNMLISPSFVKELDELDGIARLEKPPEQNHFVQPPDEIVGCIRRELLKQTPTVHPRTSKRRVLSRLILNVKKLFWFRSLKQQIVCRFADLGVTEIGLYHQKEWTPCGMNIRTIVEHNVYRHYITGVEKHSLANQLGLQNDDELLKLNKTPVIDMKQELVKDQFFNLPINKLSTFIIRRWSNDSSSGKTNTDYVTIKATICIDEEDNIPAETTVELSQAKDYHLDSDSLICCRDGKEQELLATRDDYYIKTDKMKLILSRTCIRSNASYNFHFLEYSARRGFDFVSLWLIKTCNKLKSCYIAATNDRTIIIEERQCTGDPVSDFKACTDECKWLLYKVDGNYVLESLRYPNKFMYSDQDTGFLRLVPLKAWTDSKYNIRTQFHCST